MSEPLAPLPDHEPQAQPETPDYAPPAPIAENVLRGALFAAIAIPVGVIVWAVIWSFGFIVSIVAFGVAAAAVWLYTKGSGGVIGRAGAFVVSGVVLVTLLLAFWVGLVVDYVRAVAEVTGLTYTEAFTNDVFWPAFNSDFGYLIEQNGFNFLLAIAFGVLGAFSVIRGAFRTAKAREAAQAAAYGSPYVEPSAEFPGVPPVDGATTDGTAPAATSPATASVPPRYGELAPEQSAVPPIPAATPAATPPTDDTTAK